MTSAWAESSRPFADVDTIADVLLRSPALVLTGAGISTESGIPDYRGPDGKRRVTPMEHMSSSAAALRGSGIGLAPTSGGHGSMAPNQTTGIAASPRLQRSGHLGAIITQTSTGCTSAQAPVR